MPLADTGWWLKAWETDAGALSCVLWRTADAGTHPHGPPNVSLTVERGNPPRLCTSSAGLATLPTDLVAEAAAEAADLERGIGVAWAWP